MTKKELNEVLRQRLNIITDRTLTAYTALSMDTLPDIIGLLRIIHTQADAAIHDLEHYKILI